MNASVDGRVGNWTDLPEKSCFKSLMGSTLRIDSDKPKDMIELLGQVLGIMDYQTNKASFWFLDTLALQIHRYKNDLNDYHRSVLISWLTGEMNLIRDKKLARENFFQRMKKLFLMAGEEITKNQRLVFWEEILTEDNVEEKELKKDGNSEKSTDSLASVDRSVKSNSQKNFKGNTSRSKKENSTEQIPDSENPRHALDILIEATYNMYGGKLRYALVYTVFVEKLEIQTYRLPSLLRKPRPAKLDESTTHPFSIRLQRKLRNIHYKESDGKQSEKKAKDKKNSKQKDSEFDAPVAPAPSLQDDEALIEKRTFILPLIEANEAARFFDQDTFEE